MNNIQVKVLGAKELMVKEGRKVLVKLFSVIPVTIKKDTINHHILLVDISGSMHYNIPELIKKLKVCLQQLCVDGNNYVSVITYSGHGESKRIINAVKCDEMSYKMARVYETVDAELYSKGVTVMSEPLNMAIEIAKQLGSVCDNHHVALFTDGCLVPTRWGCREEEDKCFNVADICRNENIVLNAIGFGRYYDRNFLKAMVERASNGQLVHIDEIKNYSETILELVRLVNNSEVIEVPVENKEFFVLNGAKMFTSPATIKNFQKNTDNIIAVFDGDLVVDGEVYKADNKVEGEVVEDFLYALALSHVINEDVDSAEVVVAQTGDVNMFGTVNNCYSFEEKGKVMSALTGVITDKSNRFKEGKKAITVLTAEEEPICLLEILDSILNDNKSRMLWDFAYKYKRITQKSVSIQDTIHFVYPEEGYGNVTSISIGSEKLNIGVKVEIPGKVVDEESGMEHEAKIYKDYNLVVNGNVNTEELWCELSDDLFIKFHNAGIVKSSILWKNRTVHVLDLTKVKATNKRTLKLMSQDTLVKSLYRIEELGVHQWAIRQLIKDLTVDTDRLEFSGLSEQEIEVRRFLRINEKGVYEPLKVEKDETTAFEVYPATVMEWKVEKFPKTALQKTVKADYENDIKGMEKQDAYNLLNGELIKVQDEKRTLEQKVNIVRISSALTNKSAFMWESTITKDKKVSDKVLNRNMVVGETMNVSTKVLDGVNLRQDKYTVLIKAN